MNALLGDLTRATARIDALRRALSLAGGQATEAQRQALTEAEEALRKARRGATVPAAIINTKAGDGGETLGGETTGVEAVVRQRFAAVPTAVAHLLNEPLLQVDLTNIKSKGLRARLRVRAEIVGYSAPATASREVERGAGKGVTVDLSPTLYPHAIRDVYDQTRASLHVVVDYLDGETKVVELDETRPIDLLPRTSAYLGILDPATGRWRDLSPWTGAWVTPNEPAVMAFLRDVADASPEKQVVGYQVDERGIEAQVKAAFEALHKHGIVYVNSVLTNGNTAAQYFQRVRLPAESLKTKSANCIDGTVLMASLLEAASLEPALVLVPGHAFLAWRTKSSEDSRRAIWRYVETTMIQHGDFAAACKSGEATARKYEAEAKAAADPDEATLLFSLLPIRELRERGIVPMG